MVIVNEGAEHSLVQDTNKFTCSFCNGTTLQASKLGDEPEDVTEDTDFTDLGLTNATYRTATVGLCQCGHTRLLHIQLWDTWTFTGAETTPIGTNLDSTVANSLAGWWFVCCVGTDIWKYVAISANGIGTPTTITLAYNIADNADGVSYVTNIEPVGLTKITS